MKAAPIFETMTHEQIESQAAEKTAAISAAIKSFISDRRKEKNGINLVTVGEAAGIQNLGTILYRPGITMHTVLRVLGALEVLCIVSGKSIKPLQSEIVDILTD